MTVGTVSRGPVPAALEGPLDRAVRQLFGVSWGKARGWIESGKIAVRGEVVRDATARVTQGAEIVFDERARRHRPDRLNDEDVIHVDPHVIVVNKPPGLSTVPFDAEVADDVRATSMEDTLESRVRAWIERRDTRGARGRPTLGVVHRLDKETSGLVVFTRSWMAKRSLAGQFRAHSVHRRYLAIAHGDVRTRTVRSFLIENRGDGLRGSARGTPGASAREAITHIERLEPLAGATFVACRLETGRTHQIRIHLSESGNPIVGERVYVRRFAGVLLEAPRLMLHAAELGFVHPATQQEMKWEQKLPADVEKVLARLRGKAAAPSSTSDR